MEEGSAAGDVAAPDEKEKEAAPPKPARATAPPANKRPKAPLSAEAKEALLREKLKTKLPIVGTPAASERKVGARAGTWWLTGLGWGWGMEEWGGTGGR
jgi:hypothetical protein